MGIGALDKSFPTATPVWIKTTEALGCNGTQAEKLTCMRCEMWISADSLLSIFKWNYSSRTKNARDLILTGKAQLDSLVQPYAPAPPDWR